MMNRQDAKDAKTTFLKVLSIPGAFVVLAVHLSCGSNGSSTPNVDASAPDASTARACTLASAGAQVSLLSFSGRHVSAPQMVVIDRGSSSSPASLAVQAFANASATGIPDDIEIARARVDRAWPSGATIDRAPELLGELALGFAQLAAGPPSPGGVALVWHRDEIGVGQPQFRAFDPIAWSASDVVVLAMKGDAILSLVASDAGYGVVWRDLNAPGVGPVQPLFVELDAHGAVVRGPFAIAGQVDYPGPAPSLVWIDGGFLVATGFKDCGPGDATCVAHAVVVGAVAASSINGIAKIDAIDPSTAPGHVSAATFENRVYIAWSEGDEANDKAPRTVRIATLDSHGIPIGSPVTLATTAPVTTAVSITASELGLVVTWAENGDASLPTNAVGSSRIVVRHVGFDGVLAAPLAIDATFVDTYGPPTSATLVSPRSALVLWAGRSTIDADPDVAWLARFDCTEP